MIFKCQELLINVSIKDLVSFVEGQSCFDQCEFDKVALGGKKACAQGARVSNLFSLNLCKSD